MMGWTGRLIQRQRCINGSQILRIEIGPAAADAKPGWLARIDDAAYPLMRASPAAGWVDILAPEHAWPWPLGSARQLIPVNDHAAATQPSASLVLAVGEQFGLAPVVFLCDRLRCTPGTHVTALLGDIHRFPFQPAPSRMIVPHLPAHVIATAPLLEDWHIACRLASKEESAGCHVGRIEELAQMWLVGNKAHLADAMVYISGDAHFCQRVAQHCQHAGAAHQRLPVD